MRSRVAGGAIGGAVGYTGLIDEPIRAGEHSAPG